VVEKAVLDTRFYSEVCTYVHPTCREPASDRPPESAVLAGAMVVFSVSGGAAVGPSSGIHASLLAGAYEKDTKLAQKLGQL
jgi:hypothetical protein